MGIVGIVGIVRIGFYYYYIPVVMLAEVDQAFAMLPLPCLPFIGGCIADGMGWDSTLSLYHYSRPL